MKTLNKRQRLAFLFAAPLAALSTAASAADVSFRFHAADLGAPAALYERMADRADAACSTKGRKGLWSIKAEQRCKGDLLEDFVNGAASPALTAIHEQSGGARLAGLR